MFLKAVCCDIDRTLVHASAPSKNVIMCSHNTAVSKQTVLLLEALINRGALVVLATGRRTRNYQAVSSILPHHYALIEHGGSIVDAATGRSDSAWEYVLEPWLHTVPGSAGILWKFAKRLQEKAILLDAEGRVSSFRIVGSRNVVREALSRIGGLPAGLQAICNMRKVDVIPSASGKLNALKFLADKRGISLEYVAAIGDDENDHELLGAVGTPCTFSVAHSEVVEVVRARGGYVTAEQSHAGIVAILEHLLTTAVKH